MINRDSLRHKAGHLAAMVLLILLSLWITTQLRPLREWTTIIPYGDGSILAYILGWGAHSLVTNPFSYYNIPIGFPKQMVLAGMDGMIFQAILAMPAWFTTHNIPLVFYSTILMSMVFSAVAAYWSCYLLLKSRLTSLVVAVLFTVTTDRFFHSIGHLNLIFTGFVPLSFSLTYQALSHPSRRCIISAALAIGLSIFASNYLFVLSVLTAVFAVVCFLAASGLMASWARLKTIVAVFALAALLAAPIASVHLYAKGNAGSDRTSLNVAEQFDATIAGWFMPPNRPGTDVSRYAKLLEIPEETAHRGENCQFLGVAIIFLLLLECFRLGYSAINGYWSKQDSLSAALIVSGFFLFLSSFGPRIQIGGWRVPGPYTILHALYFQFTGFFRVPSRLAFVTEWMFALAIGIGFVKYLANYKKARIGLAAGIVLVTLFEHVPATPQNGYSVSSAKIIPELDKQDPTGKEAVVVLPDPGNLGPVVYSTMHNWRPVANAWPDNPLLTDYTRFFIMMTDLVSTRSVAAAAARDIKWVITQNGEMGAKGEASMFLEKIAVADSNSLFKIKDPAALVSIAEQARKERQVTVDELRQGAAADLKLTVANQTLKPAYGLETEVQLSGDALTLTPKLPNLVSFNVSLPPDYHPAQWDFVKVSYTMAKHTDYDISLYWGSSAIPLSERTHVFGKTDNSGSDYVGTISLSNHPDWLWEDSISTLRIDFGGQLEPGNVISVRSVTFTRSAAKAEVSL